MSMEFVNDVVVKEEYISNRSELDFYGARATEEANTRCGEVFMDSTGWNFTFVCTRCLHSFPDLPSFGEHIRGAHPLHRDEFHAPVVLRDDILLKTEYPDKAENESEPNTDVGDEEDKFTIAKESRAFKQYAEKLPIGIPPKQIKQNRSKTYCCFSCGLTIIDFGRYRNHYRTEHPTMIEKDDSIDTGSSNLNGFVPRVPEKMICRYCLKSFHHPETYHAHITNEHTIKIYSCPHCPKTFVKRYSRDYHVDAHEGRKPHQCPHCPKAFSHPNNLQTHIKAHLNIKKFSCRFCDKKYVRGTELKIHERTHTKEKPYQCDECGMAYVAQVQLTKHMRRHRNIKNYKCPYCEKDFYTSNDQKRHIRTHTRERPFSCDICNKKFRATAALRSHKLLHSAEKKYACKLCEKTFAQHAGLYSHMKSHGGIK